MKKWSQVEPSEKDGPSEKKSSSKKVMLIEKVAQSGKLESKE